MLNYKKPLFWIVLFVVLAVIVGAVVLLTRPDSSTEQQEPGIYISLNCAEDLIYSVQLNVVLSDDTVFTEVCQNADNSGLKAGDTLYFAIQQPGIIDYTLTACDKNGSTLAVASFTDDFGPETRIDIEITADLQIVQESADYTLTQMDADGQVLHTMDSLSGDAANIIKKMILHYLSQSTLNAGLDSSQLEEHYQIDVRYPDGAGTTYYVYTLDGQAVIQTEAGLCAPISNELYATLSLLMQADVQGPDTDDESSITVPNSEMNQIEPLIGEAIIHTNKALYGKGDFVTESHNILAAEAVGNQINAYAVALYAEFAYKDGWFVDVNAVHQPIVLSFEKNTDGSYELTEYWTPEEGDAYTQSIMDKFPAEIVDKALNTQKYYFVQMQICYVEATMNYGSADNYSTIDSLINTIAATPANSSDVQSHIDENFVDYRQLIYYSDFTLRYCFDAFNHGGQTGLKGAIMAMACQDIMSVRMENLLEDQDYSNGQEWYDALKQKALELKEQYSDDKIKDVYPSIWLLLQMRNSAEL